MKPLHLLPAFFILLFTAGSLCAQHKSKRTDPVYKTELKKLHAAIQKHFYDSAAGYYKEVAGDEKHDNPYSYLWPVCALYQAANEMETMEPGANYLQPMRRIIAGYYDPAPPAPGYASYIMKMKGGDRFYDDNQWLGITALDAYAKKADAGQLQFGKTIYRYMMTGFDTVLGGGIYWQETKKTSKNTCSNGPGIILALQLYKATKDKSYLDTALLIYNWMNRELKAPSGLYWDNVGVGNRKIGKATYSYNTGTMLQSNIYLYEITGDKKYVTEAIAIADSSLSYFYGGGKFRDNYWFNAVLLRGYQHLLRHHGDLKYIIGFKQSLDDALRNSRDTRGLFTGKKTRDLVEHGGMLEILARFALLEQQYGLLRTSAKR